MKILKEGSENVYSFGEIVRNYKYIGKKILSISYSVDTDTSRPPKSYEVQGREYNFITRREMESAILARRYS